MKGVKNKLGGNAANVQQKTASPGLGKNKRKKSITAGELARVNRRLDQCLPMETLEWQRVEQLLMQVLEFAPTALVYETGMAVALYADDQARRAYLLGQADMVESSESRSEDAA